MTIDFSQTTGELYFYGTRASAVTWHCKLKSKYNNDYLKFGASTTELSLTVDQYKTNWYSFDWSNSYNQTRDIAGYYFLHLYGDSVLLLSKLVKVVNSSANPVDVKFVSTDNENNEQVIYYR